MSIALITGATRNTGYAIARRFAQAGYDVVITSRDKESAAAAAEKLMTECPNVRVLGVGVQLDNVSEIRAAFEEVKRVFGRLDVLVNNAAHLGIGFSILNTTEADWDSVVNANARGAFFCCQEAVKLMDKGGAICMISSVHSKGCIPARVLYSASKGAINTMAKALSIELAHLNIRVNTILAGAIWSERWNDLNEEQKAARRKNWPLGKESMPEDIANGVYFLCSDQSPTITGAELAIDSGVMQSLLPYNKEWTKS